MRGLPAEAGVAQAQGGAPDAALQAAEAKVKELQAALGAQTEGHERAQAQIEDKKALLEKIKGERDTYREAADDHKQDAELFEQEKEQAAFAKKQARKDKEWEKGAKDTSKTDAAAASSAEKSARLMTNPSRWYSSSSFFVRGRAVLVAGSRAPLVASGSSIMSAAV